MIILLYLPFRRWNVSLRYSIRLSPLRITSLFHLLLMIILLYLPFRRWNVSLRYSIRLSPLRITSLFHLLLMIILLYLLLIGGMKFNVIQSGCRLFEIHPIPPTPHDHCALPYFKRWKDRVTFSNQAVASSKHTPFHLLLMIIVLYLTLKDGKIG
jgi:hypothetical protein